jgi:hypothetical protein
MSRNAYALNEFAKPDLKGVWEQIHQQMVVGFGYASLDLFTIDVMTEMLQSPLHFLSYFKQRARYADQLLAWILAYHLK